MIPILRKWHTTIRNNNERPMREHQMSKEKLCVDPGPGSIKMGRVVVKSTSTRIYHRDNVIPNGQATVQKWSDAYL